MLLLKSKRLSYKCQLGFLKFCQISIDLNFPVIYLFIYFVFAVWRTATKSQSAPFLLWSVSFQSCISIRYGSGFCLDNSDKGASVHWITVLYSCCSERWGKDLETVIFFMMRWMCVRALTEATAISCYAFITNSKWSFSLCREIPFFPPRLIRLGQTGEVASL